MLTKPLSFFLALCLVWCFAAACSTNVAAATQTATSSPTVTWSPTPAATATTIPSATPPASPTGASLMTVTGAFFALSVTDVNAGAKWYSDKLGLKVVMQPPKANKSSVIVLEGDGLIVELIQNDDAKDLSQVAPSIHDPMLVHGIVKAGVIVDNLDATVAGLKARNVKIAFGPFPATASQRANVIIRDNEGNLIQFFGQK